MESWKKVEKCKSPKPNASSVDAAFKKENAAYEQCRDEEKDLELDDVKCKIEADSIEAMMSADAKMKEVQGHLMVDKTVCKTAFGEDYGMQLERLASTWDDAFRKLAASQGGGEKYNKSLAEQKAKCKKSTKLQADKLKACKSSASKMDKAKCAVAEYWSKHCATYTKCFVKAETKYSLLVKTVKQALGLIKDQLNALDQVSCYIKAADKVDKLEECKNIEKKDFDDFDIDFPIAGNGECYEPPYRPCTVGYVTVHYDGEAEWCTPCIGVKGKIGDL